MSSPPGPLFEDFIPYRLHRLSTLLNQQLAADLGALGINIARWRVLALSMLEDGRTVSALAEAAMIEQSALSRMVINMEREGLVRREPDLADQRRVRVWLESAGRALFHQLYPTLIRRNAACVAALRDGEVEQLKAMLDRMTERVAAAAKE
ncbi:MAG: MarR family transcriptional regulator [Sphingomonadaceae bacterium]|nr:MarR family transcriptional regulator [Sphingomonadaceae bacterium]